MPCSNFAAGRRRSSSELLRAAMGEACTLESGDERKDRSFARKPLGSIEGIGSRRRHVNAGQHVATLRLDLSTSSARAQSDISRRDTVKAPEQSHVFSGPASVEEANASCGTGEFEGIF